MDKIYTANELFALNNNDEILALKTDDLKKRSFCHYTTVDKAKLILQPKEDGNYYMFASNLKGMNDKKESALHKENQFNVHSLCFCNTKHEKIPLWYLYSGICGKGAHIRFTPGKFLEFLRSIKTVYPVYENSECDFDNPIELDNENFELQLGWVYYIMQGNNRVIYYKDNLEVEKITLEEKKSSYFIKDYPWEYECEFRIVIINKTDKLYDKLAIRIPKEIVKALRIGFAPEVSNSEALKKEFSELGIAEKNIKSSELEINMNLLRRNQEDLINAIPEIFTVEEIEKIYQDMKLKKGMRGDTDNI